MKCAIMQPTYLPWAGYFNLMTSVDTFVFLDDAQFQKNSWHSRNRLWIDRQLKWITVPTRNVKLNQLLTETLLCEEKHWRRKHSIMLRQTFARHAFKAEVNEIAEFILQDQSTNLAALNISLIRFIAQKLAISTEVKLSSQMSVDGRRSEKILNILRVAHSTLYLSPLGASEYLEEDKFTSQTDIQLKFQDFIPKPYTQYRSDKFVPYISVVDVIANIGWAATAAYVRNKS